MILEDADRRLKNDDDQKFVDQVVSSIRDLEGWVSRNGWEGYDPYDLKGTAFFIWALKLPKTSLLSKLKRKLILGPLIIGDALFPRILRFIFSVKPKINAKGMALFAKAYLQLYEITAQEEHRRQALACLDWLSQNTSMGYEHPCWGYPFDWQNYVLVPAGTPASVVSVAACDAYWTAWKVLGNPAYLDVCVGTCRFFINHLSIDHIDDETVCFSYTPLDDFHVHNTNLLVAEQLIRVGKQVGNQEWVRLGLRAGNYALTEQNPDGSLYYWGRLQNHLNPNRIDHYHSGFEIRSLYAIWKLTGLDQYRVAAEKYYEFYLGQLVEYREHFAIPKMYPHAVYPINIHSCAEALLLNATMAVDHEQSRDLVKLLFFWIRDHMQSREGYFFYMRRRLIGLDVTSSIPYLRWGQAWMLLALTQILQLSDGDHR